MRRLPSFNDFSPEIIKDVRRPLEMVAKLAPDRDAVVAAWDQAFFAGKGGKRARTNIPATLSSIGLIERQPLALSKVGKSILATSSPTEAARQLTRHIVDSLNGMAIIDAVRSLNARGEKLTKASLKRELQLAGIEKLSNATTDHTTLLNWMIKGGLFTRNGRANPVPDETVMKAVLGLSSTERSSFTELTLAQQIFLEVLRRVAEGNGGTELQAKQIIDECLRDHRSRFDEDQIRAKVINPLVEADWIEIPAGQAPKGRGGKSGVIKPSGKLMSIPIDAILPDFDQIVPADLRAKIDLPSSEVKRLLDSRKKHEKGLGLELLALKMILDLGLEPRAFRLRSRDTAHAEVDLTAEGKNLMFSRWNFQCKCISSKVSLGDVAKEVGLAIYSRAHVVAVVTTTDFSSEALAYAREVTATTHLQFLLVPGKVVQSYLDRGPNGLLDHVTANAARVMLEKRGQPIAPEEED